MLQALCIVCAVCLIIGLAFFIYYDIYYPLKLRIHTGPLEKRYECSIPFYNFKISCIDEYSGESEGRIRTFNKQRIISLTQSYGGIGHYYLQVNFEGYFRTYIFFKYRRIVSLAYTYYWDGKKISDFKEIHSDSVVLGVYRHDRKRMNKSEIDKKAKRILGEDARIKWTNSSFYDFTVDNSANYMYIDKDDDEIRLTDMGYYEFDEKGIEQHIRALKKSLKLLRLIKKLGVRE